MFMHRLVLALSVTTALILNAGCGSKSENQTPTAGAGHDHGHAHGHDHHHAETLSEAVTELTEMRNVIRDAFAKDDIDTAHDPLHEVAHVLELIPGLAHKQGITGEALESINSHVQTLFEAFGNVDKTLHGGEGSTYSEESAKIDAAVSALTELASSAAVGSEPDAGADQSTDSGAESPTE